jgi:MYXO-CTERM domain-containing protein
MSRLGSFAILALTLAVTSTSRPSEAAVGVGNNAVGVNAHVASQAFVDAVEDLGAGWIRLDGDWWTLHTGPGSFSWSHLDQAVTRANAADLDILITFAYTPAWVPRSGTDGVHRTDVPDSSAEWVAFLTEAIPRYRAMGVRHFGVWNEPNLENFFNGTVDDYIDVILVPGAAAIRDACADCYVVGPHLSHNTTVDEYLRRILDRAGADVFDIIAHHVYYGFAETGRTWPWDRRFEHALDEDCYQYTTCATPLRDVLDEFGYTGEVWMAETGYRADPGDAEDEDVQKTYVLRVLEEQLARDWYTNTFFYEIHDCGPDVPGCTIDGFGLMRATGGTYGSRVFPGQFRLKPAFHALKAFIADHPELSAPPIEVEPLEVLAYRATDIDVDGALDDFGHAGWQTLGADDWVGIDGAGAGGVHARFATRWDAQTLYLAVEVDDPEHHNESSAENLWMGDSIQVAFDVGLDGGFGYDDVDDHEFGFALSNGAVVAYRFHGPPGATDAWDAEVARSGGKTRYEIALSGETLGIDTFAPDRVIGFSMLVNVADSAGRRGWLELTPGIGATKAPIYFAELRLLDATGEDDPGDDDGDDPGDEDGDVDPADPDDGGDDGDDPDPDPADPDDGEDGDGGDGSDDSDGPGEDPGDADPPGSGGESDDADLGCGGCSSTGGGPQGMLAGLLGLLLLASRRRLP